MWLHLLYGGLLAAAFVLGLLIGRLGMKTLRRDHDAAVALTKHQAVDLQRRSLQLARKEDQLEAVEAQLLEANAELVVLRGNGPEAA